MLLSHASSVSTGIAPSTSDPARSSLGPRAACSGQRRAPQLGHAGNLFRRA